MLENIRELDLEVLDGNCESLTIPKFPDRNNTLQTFKIAFKVFRPYIWILLI